jgi:hypothetical protein
METEEINPSVRADEIQSYIEDEQCSPIRQLAPFSHEDVRLIILDLRDVLRAQLGKVPLSEEQRSSWDFALSEGRQWSPEQRASKPWAETYHPSTTEVADAISALEGSASELLSVLRRFLAHNRVAEGSGDRTLSIQWAHSPLLSRIGQIRPDLDAHGLNNLKNLIIEALR